MTAVTHARVAVPRSRRPAGWWAKAWLRAVEETAYGEQDLRRGRSLARSGDVGSVTVDSGSFLAAVLDGDDAWTVTGTVGTWDDVALEDLVGIVAARAGRVGALLAGDLPLDLVEDAEEAGVELVPYAGELATGCTCDHWTDPCAHALAVMLVLTRLVDVDPLVLLGLRGLDREDLLARLHARGPSATPGGADTDYPPPAQDLDLDLDTGLDAAVRAVRALELLERDDGPVAHLF